MKPGEIGLGVFVGVVFSTIFGIATMCLSRAAGVEIPAAIWYISSVQAGILGTVLGVAIERDTD